MVRAVQCASVFAIVRRLAGAGCAVAMIFSPPGASVLSLDRLRTFVAILIPPRHLSGRGTSRRLVEGFFGSGPLHHASHGPPPLQRQGRIYLIVLAEDVADDLRADPYHPEGVDHDPARLAADDAGAEARLGARQLAGEEVLALAGQ